MIGSNGMNPYEDVVGRMGKGCDPKWDEMKESNIVFWIFVVLLCLCYVYQTDWVPPLILVSMCFFMNLLEKKEWLK